jgi:two-component system, response regulator
VSVLELIIDPDLERSEAWRRSVKCRLLEGGFLEREHEIERAGPEVTILAILMVIDDNPGDIRLIRGAVAQADPSMEVVAFDGGPEALDALCGNGPDMRPDAILLDLQLRTGNGLDLLRVIRFVPRLAEVPVVILTSSTGASDEHRSRLLGASSFLSKPLNVDDYLQVMRQIVHQIRNGPASTAGTTNDESRELT